MWMAHATDMNARIPGQAREWHGARKKSCLSARWRNQARMIPANA